MAISEKVPVRLNEEQRRTLHRITKTGTHPSAMLRRAQILLKSDADGPDGWSDKRTGKTLGCSFMTVRRVRQQFDNEKGARHYFKKVPGTISEITISQISSYLAEGVTACVTREGVWDWGNPQPYTSVQCPNNEKGARHYFKKVPGTFFGVSDKAAGYGLKAKSIKVQRFISRCETDEGRPPARKRCQAPF